MSTKQKMPHTKRSKYALVLRIAWISLSPINCVWVLVSLKMELLSLEANWYCTTHRLINVENCKLRLWGTMGSTFMMSHWDHSGSVWFWSILPSHPLGCDPGVASCSHCGSWEDRVTADPSHVYISNVSPSFPPCHLDPHQPLIMASSSSIPW